MGLLINYAATFAVQLPFLIVQQVLMFREIAAGQTDTAVLMESMAWLQVPSQALAVW